MLTINATKRLRCFEILHAHHFFRDLDFDRVEGRMVSKCKVQQRTVSV